MSLQWGSDFPDASGIRKPELQMARTLVEQLADKWDPTQYTDEYRENLMKVIQAKVKGKKIDLAPAEEPRQAEVVDLMERLRRSLEQGGGGKGARKTAARAKTRAGTAKRATKKRTRSAA